MSGGYITLVIFFQLSAWNKNLVVLWKITYYSLVKGVEDVCFQLKAPPAKSRSRGLSPNLPLRESLKVLLWNLRVRLLKLMKLCPIQQLQSQRCLPCSRKILPPSLLRMPPWRQKLLQRLVSVRISPWRPRNQFPQVGFLSILKLHCKATLMSSYGSNFAPRLVVLWSITPWVCYLVHASLYVLIHGMSVGKWVVRVIFKIPGRYAYCSMYTVEVYLYILLSKRGCPIVFWP